MVVENKGKTFHIPVLLEEAIGFLDVKPGEEYIDATVGGGGHAVEILKRGGVLLGVDRDPEAIEAAEKRLKDGRHSETEGRRISKGVPRSTQDDGVVLVQGNFKDIDSIAREHGFKEVSGILYDLGMSSFQIEKSGRGFSFSKDEPLDMRMDPSLKVTAADLINGLHQRELYELFQNLGEERRFRAIAKAVVRARDLKPIKTSKELADVVVQAVGWHEKGFHPATRVFQALRIAVNDELNNLEVSLSRAAPLLRVGGRLVVISFHSLEDRIVKRLKERPCWKVLIKKPVRASREEVGKNPRARSARLRAFERVFDRSGNVQLSSTKLQTNPKS